MHGPQLESCKKTLIYQLLASFPGLHAQLLSLVVRKRQKLGVEAWERGYQLPYQQYSYILSECSPANVLLAVAGAASHNIYSVLHCTGKAQTS